jgi:hypothetical protein
MARIILTILEQQAITNLVTVPNSKLRGALRQLFTTDLTADEFPCPAVLSLAT